MAIEGAPDRSRAAAFAAGLPGLPGPGIAAFAKLVIGVANPKSYPGDIALKWLLGVWVMVVVDLAWLLTGSILHKLRLGRGPERAINIAMGIAILAPNPLMVM